MRLMVAGMSAAAIASISKTASSSAIVLVPLMVEPSDD